MSAFRRRCSNTCNNYKIGFFRGFYCIIIIFHNIIISYKLHMYNYNYTLRYIGTCTGKKRRQYDTMFDELFLFHLRSIILSFMYNYVYMQGGTPHYLPKRIMKIPILFLLAKCRRQYTTQFNYFYRNSKCSTKRTPTYTR